MRPANTGKALIHVTFTSPAPVAGLVFSFLLILPPAMRPSFLFRSALLLFFWWGSSLAAHASHLLGADLTYAYAGTAALPNQYRVTARLFQDARRRAAKERLISEATARISGAFNIENILQTTAEELERVLGGSEISIQFQSKESL